MFTAFDWFCLVMGIVGNLMIVYLFYLNDFDVEKTMFGDDNDSAI